MGYTTGLTGHIKIEPPLKWTRSKDHPLYVPDGKEPAGALKLLVVEDQVETDDGKLARLLGVALVFAWDYPVTCYDILSELQQAVDYAGPGHEHIGEMYASGEDWNDLWKLAVVKGKASRLIPTITWPDGTVEDNDRYTRDRNGHNR